jgi:hypothetical protein
MTSQEHRDLNELSSLRKQVRTAAKILSEYADMSKNGALCCGCNSGRRKDSCPECGIKITQIKAQKWLRDVSKSA